MGLFRQMIGRVLRPAEGKPDAIILDHSGAVFLHGLPEDFVEWTLDPDDRAVAPAHQARLERKIPNLIECTQCSTLRMGGKPCPNCGFLPQRPGKYVAIREGDLGLIVNGKVRAGPMTREQRLQFYRELRGFGRAHNMRNPDGWAFHQCQHKGFKPPWAWRDQPPLEPSLAVASWARSRIIAYAKARDRSAA